MVKNIFITGKPGCGKTTLIKQIIKELNIPARGFYTEEIREKGERVGFEIITLKGKKGILAKQDYEGPFKVSKYGVILKDLEEIGVKEMDEGIGKDCIIVVDEVGKMELFSEKFKEILLKALNSENKVLGTIMMKSNPFCDEIKRRGDTLVLYLDRTNREKIKEEIKKILLEKG